MNARKCVHAQKPYPSQAFDHKSSKVGGIEEEEKERKRDRKEKGQRLMDRKAAQQNENTYEELKTRPTYAQLRLTKHGEER